MKLRAGNFLASYGIMVMEINASRLCNSLHNPYLALPVFHSQFKHHFLHTQMMVRLPPVYIHKILKSFTDINGKKLRKWTAHFDS